MIRGARSRRRVTGQPPGSAPRRRSLDGRGASRAAHRLSIRRSGPARKVTIGPPPCGQIRLRRILDEILHLDAAVSNAAERSSGDRSAIPRLTRTWPGATTPAPYRAITTTVTRAGRAEVPAHQGADRYHRPSPRGRSNVPRRPTGAASLGAAPNSRRDPLQRRRRPSAATLGDR